MITDIKDYKNIMKLLISLFCVVSTLSFFTNYLLKNTLPYQVETTAKVLTNLDFSKNFCSLNYFKNRDLRNKFSAVELTIKNVSNKDFLLSKENIDLKLQSPQEIEKKLKTNNIIAPLAAAGIASCALIFGLGAALLPSVLAGTAAGTSATIITLTGKNNIFHKNIKNKSLDFTHGIYIPAHETIKTTIFLKKENLKNNFSIKLLDVKSNKYLGKTITV